MEKRLMTMVAYIETVLSYINPDGNKRWHEPQVI